MNENPQGGPRPFVYFDCNSTTPLIEEAARAASLALHERYANPSSLHWEGCQAKAIREGARKAAAELFGAETKDIIFTSGATESIHTAVFGALLPEALRLRQGGALGRHLVVYGATEHKVVPEALKHWVRALDLPFQVLALPVDRSGHFDTDWLRERRDSCYLLCTMAVNNETGLIQDLDAIAKVVGNGPSRPLWLVDGVAALGKVDLKWSTRPIDYMAFSGHKVHAPKGTGLLVIREGSPCEPLLVGGGQEAGRRSGTEPLPALAGFGKVLELFARAREGVEDSPQRSGDQARQRTSLRSSEELESFKRKLVTALEGAFPGFSPTVPGTAAVPTTIHFSVPGFSSAQIWMLLEAHGVFVSSGSACQSAKQGFSHVLQAMGAEEWRLASAARLSFGLAATPREIEDGVRAIESVGVSLRKAMAGVSGFVRIHNGVTCAYLLVDPATGAVGVWGNLQQLGTRVRACLEALASAQKTVTYGISGLWSCASAQGEVATTFQESSPKEHALPLGKSSFAESGVRAIGKSTYLVTSWGKQSFGALPLLICADKQAPFAPELMSELEENRDYLGLICEDSTAYSGVPFLIRKRSILTIDIDHATEGIALDGDAYGRLKASAPVRVVDVRERFEQAESSPFHAVRSSVLPGLESLPFSELPIWIRDALSGDPGQASTWLFVCRSGTRSRYAAELFRLLGWQKAYSLHEGLLGLGSKLNASRI